MQLSACSYANRLECGDVEAALKEADHVIEGTYKVRSCCGGHISGTELCPLSCGVRSPVVLRAHQIGRLYLAWLWQDVLLMATTFLLSSTG